MSTATDNRPYEGYFAARGVQPDSYDDYVLPKYIQDVLPGDKNQSVLDIGSGYCQMLKHLRRQGFKNLHGVDISRDAVAHGVTAGLDIQLISDLKDYLLQQQGHYDLVVMSHVIEHIEKDQIIEILRLIRSRLLTPSGSLFLATPNAQSTTGCYWAYEDFTHTTMFTGGSMSYVLKRAGFETVRFLDPAGLEDLSMTKKVVRRSLQAVYRGNLHFWNWIMNSSFHRPSPEIFGWQLCVLAR